MATGTGKHKLLSTGPTEPWSIREKLCLASSVMRSGDQNWVSVSRAIKPFAEPGRPPDWFSQKHCASQYSELLETTETPKRKRGEKGEVVETVEDVIVRKLTAERVEELKKVIKETQEKYRRLKRDAELIQAGHMDSRLDELCNDIAMKKKLEEEEAEVKRKATDAAYQARQAVKTPPRRLPTVMVRSPIDSASPGGDYPLADLTATTMEEAASGVNESEMAVASGHLNSTGVLLEVGGVLPMIHGGEMQQTPSTVAASPAASGTPTLSRLLEAGPTQFTTPLASFTTVASEPPVKLVAPSVESVSQATIVMMPALPAPSSAPAVSTPESVAPVSQPDTCVPMEAVGDPHTVTVSMDSSEISMIINSIKEECFRSGVAEAPGGSKAPSIDGKEDLDLAEKMDIAVSYTGEELDFETVGDIIAIIEDKVDDHPEVLDVAAVDRRPQLGRRACQLWRQRWEEAAPMGSQHPPLAALYLLELLVTSCLGGLKVEERGLAVRLSGSGSPCQGRLEVSNGTEWYAVHGQSWGQSSLYQVMPKQFFKLCQKLQCRDPLLLSSLHHFKDRPFQKLMICHGQLGSFSNCSLNRGHQVGPLALICSEPPRTTAPPTTSPPTTTPEPTAPPRFQLVAEPGGLRCAGLVEFYSGGVGGTIGIEPQDEIKDLGQLICAALQCGSFLKPLPETEEAQTPKPGGQRPLPIRWEIQNPRCNSLEQCFRKVQPRAGGQALGLICSDFQPKVQSRLVGGSDMCEGSVEVRSGKGQQWDTLCDSSWAKGTARWEEVCREQQCGNVSFYQGLDPSEKTLGGLYCPSGILSQCHKLEEKKSYCKRVFVTCQNSSRAGLGVGAVMSIILALVLLAVLLVVCGPLAYKKVVKKFRQKKQRQWIGPTGMNQNMSFHRNHTVTVRSQAENATASHVENEYSQPPRNSQISAYPALEGALHRISTHPDNSSDSDYELHGAQRL